MRATVIVVTFNHRDIVPACLDALRATVSPRDEVVVVDNSSSDGTVDRIASEYPWVHIERCATNGGFGAAANHGASNATGEYLVFLNPDTEPRAGWLDALLEVLAATPSAGMVTAKLLLARTPGRIDAFGNEIHISGITPCRAWGEPAEWYDKVEEVSAVSGACFAISRQLFSMLGGFDERGFLYFEDTDLSLRARLAGYRCLAVPGSVVLHDHRPGLPAAKLRYLERNRWWSLLKVFRWRTLVALGPVLLLSELIAWATAAAYGPRHVRAKALAWLDLARWMPDLPRARAGVQRRRVLGDAELLRLHSTRLRPGQVVGGTLGRWLEQPATLAFAGGRALATVLASGGGR